MKRQSANRTSWLERRARAAGLWLQKQARRRKHMRRYSRRSVQVRPTVVIALPPGLTAGSGSARETITVSLQTLAMRLRTGHARVKLDFSSVRHIYPGGMLMLLAHVELLAEQFPERIKAICPPGSMAGQLIHQFGFDQRLRVPVKGNTPLHSSVTGWKFATGHSADGEKIQQHIAEFASQVTSSLPDGLQNALCEAMTNVKHHAYPAEVDVPESIRRWWIFSKCEAPQPGQSGNLYLAFYDIGIGIQNSLRQNPQGLAEHVQEILQRVGIGSRKRQDVELLRLAVEHTRTVTGLSFRGKGLPEMKEFAASTTGGKLTIISGHAQYSFQANSEDATVAKCDQGILGTLILWNLPLSWKEPTS
jgi:hypothetical protein